MLSTEQPDTDAGTHQPYKYVAVDQVQQTNFTFFEVDEISVKKKKTSRSCVAQKICGECLQNTGKAVRPANGRHTEIIPRTAKKEPADNIAN